jgi:Resolvase, N terminal domain
VACTVGPASFPSQPTVPTTVVRPVLLATWKRRPCLLTRLKTL